MLGVAIPLSYSSGRLIGWKLETWRRLGIKALVAPRSAIHHCMTVHWSGGTVEKLTRCLLMRGLTLVHSSPPSLKQSPRLSSSFPPLWMEVAAVGGALSLVCLKLRQFGSDLLITVGRGQLGKINMMMALTKSPFKLRENESSWVPLGRDHKGGVNVFFI